MKIRKREHRAVSVDSTPPGIVAADYAEEIIRLRGAMQQAVDLLDGRSHRAVSAARVLLRDTLAYEGWWK